MSARTREKMSAANRLVKQLMAEARAEARAEEAETGYDLSPTMAIFLPEPDRLPEDQSPYEYPGDR